MADIVRLEGSVIPVRINKLVAEPELIEALRELAHVTLSFLEGTVDQQIVLKVLFEHLRHFLSQ